MSRSLAWTPKGPALEIYETKIRAELEAILTNIELPEGAPLFLKLYMIGRDEASANPMIMVCCVHRVIRKEAELSIRESRVLDRFPGFGLGSSALQLGSHGVEELLTKGYQHKESQSASHQELSHSGTTLEIFGSLPHRLGGTIRFVSTSHEGVSVVHTATGGPIFQLDTELYQITAGHGMRFGAPEAKTHYTASELDECEFDGQSEYNDDITTSIGSLTPEELSTQSSEEDSRSSRLSVDESPNEDQQTPVVHSPHIKAHSDGSFLPSKLEVQYLKGNSRQLYLQFHDPDLDYILLKIPPQPGLSGSTSTLNSVGHKTKTVTKTSRIGDGNSRVLVVSPDGPIPGMISSEATSYKMRGFTKLQQLLTVELDGVFYKGYSGSAVVDFDTGAVYGQVILGSPGKSLAYCVSAPSIFADIVSKSGDVPILDNRQWQLNSQYPGTWATSTLPKIEPTESGLAKHIPASSSYSGATLRPTSPEHKPEMGTSASSEKRYRPGESSHLKRKLVSGSPQPSKGSSQKRRAAPSRSSQRTWACPFYLHDRLQHSDCLNKRMTRMSDVRQHLDRKHRMVVHCPVCGIVFAGPSAAAGQQLDDHVRAAVCEPSPAPLDYSGMTEDNVQTIRDITRQGRTNQFTEVQRWFMIWDVLFPGEARPESPFVADVPEIQRVADWARAIFNSDRWLELPLGPWTTPMSRHQQRSSMSNFIQSFIAQSRALVAEGAGSGEGQHGDEGPSYDEVDKADQATSLHGSSLPSAVFEGSAATSSSTDSGVGLRDHIHEVYDNTLQSNFSFLAGDVDGLGNFFEVFGGPSC